MNIEKELINIFGYKPNREEVQTELQQLKQSYELLNQPAYTWSEQTVRKLILFRAYVA